MARTNRTARSADQVVADILALRRRIDGECWLYIGSCDRLGYARTRVGGLDGKPWLIHRLVYTILIGPIPDDLELDHTCRRPPCFNPKHLEPVTHQVNILRGHTLPAENFERIECRRGHPFFGDNLVIGRDGRRQCRTCSRDSQRLRNEWQGAPANRLKDVCIHGHPLDGDNLIVKIRADGRTYRNCRECRNQDARERQRAKRASCRQTPTLA